MFYEQVLALFISGIVCFFIKLEREKDFETKMSGMDSLKANVRKGLLGATVSAVGAGVGGLIGGPIGMAVGGTIGGVLAATVFGISNFIDFI